MRAATGDSQKNATIRDVAHQAGVSIATVSRVINGDDNISPDIYNRTMAAIKKSNYYPRSITDISGKHVFRLKKGLHTGNIGVSLYEGSLRWRSSYMFVSYMKGIEKACSDRGYHPIVEVFWTRPSPSLPAAWWKARSTA